MIISIILVGLLMIAFRFRRTGMRVLVAGIGLLVIFAISPISLLFLFLLERQFPPADLSSLSQAPTGIVVLGGAIDSDVRRTRQIVAINERAERLTEGLVLLRKYPTAMAVVQHGGARDLFVSLGIDRQRIVVERDSNNTWENAIFAKQIAMPKPGQVWLLVTSAWHMPRAMGTFRKVGFEILPWPVDYRTVPSQNWTQFFYRPSQGLTLLDLAAKEWVGMLGYYLIGRSSELFPSPEWSSSKQ